MQKRAKNDTLTRRSSGVRLIIITRELRRIMRLLYIVFVSTFTPSGSVNFLKSKFNMGVVSKDNKGKGIICLVPKAIATGICGIGKSKCL